MEAFWSRLFLDNAPRKIAAVITAVLIWLFVNHSIIDTKTLTNVPIKIMNLPADKTIVGLMPNGVLSKRITLNLSGTKDVIDDLESGDVEVVLNASTADQDEWIVSITKKNLVSLNPDIDLGQHITGVQHNELVIKLSRLMTAKIPVTIQPPVGDPPQGYEYLDYWPQKLTQTVSGPEESVQKLKLHGFDLTFDLSDISKSDLDSVKSSSENYSDDEIRFIVPTKWKQVAIPFHNNALEEINDPEAQSLRIYFLRKQSLAVEKEIPVDVFYPLPTVETINPETAKLVAGKYLFFKNGIPVFKVPLSVKHVSKLFLNVVRDNLLLTLQAAPPKEREFFNWSIQVINPKELENTYVGFIVTKLSEGKNEQNTLPQKREQLIRKRFRDYLQRMAFYTADDQELTIESSSDNGNIVIKSY